MPRREESLRAGRGTESAAATAEFPGGRAGNSNTGIGGCGGPSGQQEWDGLDPEEWTALGAGGSRVKANCNCCHLVDGVPGSLGLRWPGEGLSMHNGYSNVSVNSTPQKKDFSKVTLIRYWNSS